MTQVTHPQMVAALVKPPLDIMVTLSQFTTDLWHGATGVAGEAGELLEGLLRYNDQLSDIDLQPIRENAMEESGDILFYMEQIVQRTGMALDWHGADLFARQQIISPDMVLLNAAHVAVYGSMVLDTVKKAAVYNKPLDIPLLTEQMLNLAQSVLVVGYQFGFSREQALAANISKLSKRYEGLAYSDKAAQERADKAVVKPTALGETPPGYEPPARSFIGKNPHTSDMQDVVDAERSA